MAETLENIPTVTAESAHKRRFALELLRSPKDVYGAIRRAMPAGSAVEAVFAAAQWPNDPEVIGYIAELSVVTPKKDQLPTKEDMARVVYDMSIDKEAKLEPKERFAGLKLYAELMGFIEKPNAGVNVQVNNQIGNKVMVVKDHGTDDEWEQRAIDQQAQLIHEARSEP